MPSSLQIGEVVFDDTLAQLPPAPTDVPPAVRSALLEALDTQPETIIHSGVSVTRIIRFASAESLGWVTYTQKLALMQLYLSRAPFAVVTDLLSVRNTAKTYSGCFFDPATPPMFAPHPVADGDHWMFDLPIRMPLVGS